MKRNYFILFFLYIVLSCCTTGRNVRGIAVSQEIIDGGDMKGINYCLLYGKALDGDITSIKDYSTIDIFQDGFIYVHGVYLIRLIDRIGDNKFLKAIEGIEESQRAMIGLYIEAGMDIYEWYPTGKGAKKYSSLDDYWDIHPIIWSFIYKGESAKPTASWGRRNHGSGGRSAGQF